MDNSTRKPHPKKMYSALEDLPGNIAKMIRAKEPEKVSKVLGELSRHYTGISSLLGYTEEELILWGVDPEDAERIE